MRKYRTTKKLVVSRGYNIFRIYLRLRVSKERFYLSYLFLDYE